MTRLRVALITLGDPGRLTGGYLYHRRMAELATRHHAEFRFVSLADRPFPLAALSSAAAIREARDQRPDVVALDSIAAAFLSPRRLRDVGAPVVGSIHQPPGGIDHGPLRRLLQAPLDRRAYRAAALLIAASDPLGAELRTQGFDDVVVVPPGRDVAAGPAVPAGDLRRGRRIAVLCVANWIRRKRLPDLLAALAALPPNAATLHLVGDTRAEPAHARRIRARLRLSPLRDRVVVHGRLRREEVAGLYAAADVFVLPSLREPFGTVWGEAMAAGLPIVGYRAGNLPHLAEDGAEALLVAPGDVRALAGALRRVAEDEGLRRRLGEAALRRAATRPTWEESAAVFFAALRRAVRRPHHETGPR